MMWFLDVEGSSWFVGLGEWKASISCVVSFGTEVRDFTLILCTSTVRAAGWMWDVRISCFVLFLCLV